MAKTPTHKELKQRIIDLEKELSEFKQVKEAMAERREVENALQESEKRYRNLQKNIPVAVFRSSDSGSLLYANPAAITMFGFDENEDLSIYQVTDFYKDPEDRQTVLIQLEAEGKVTDFETEFKRRDGSVFWGSISATQVNDKNGNFLYIDGILKDISEQKRTEEALRQEKVFTDALLNSLPGVFYVYNENQRLIRWNKNHEILSGYTAEELLFKSQKTFFENKDAEKINQFMKQVFNKGQAAGEYYVVGKDGRKGLFYFTGTRLIQNDKKYLLGVGIDITERKRAEDRLRESEERFTLAVKNSNLGMWDWNIKTGDLTFSEYWAEILEYKIDELEPNINTFESFLHPEDKDMVMESLIKHLREDDFEYNVKYRMKTKSGGWKWINSRGKVVARDKEKMAIRMVGTNNDITEREQAKKQKQFQRDLAIEISKAATLMETVEIILSMICQLDEFDSGGIYLIDKKTGGLDLILHRGLSQKLAEKIKHYDVDKIRLQTNRMGGAFWEKISEYIAPIKKDFADEGIVSLAVIPIKLGENLIGSIKMASHTHETITNYSMNILESIAELEVGVSISRIITEEALRQSEEKFRGLVESTSDWIWEVNQEAVYIYCSPQVENLLGYKPEEIVGKSPFDLMLPDEKDKIAKLFNDALKNGEPITALKNVNLHKDGHHIILETSGIPFFNENGKVAGYRGIDRDITEQMRAEEEKRKALEFAAEQSKHALIGQVAGKMAHDFNNVLMGIMGNAQLAILDCNDEKIKKKLACINEFSERGRDITNNLMSFSKDQEPKQTYFKIEDKIDLVLKMLEKDLLGIKVSRNFKPGIPELLADPGMIQDVLVNLVQNSIHAMSKVENPTLNLEAYSQDGKVYFTVEDNGCGIPKEHQDSIYTPSFTLKGGHDKIGSYESGITGTGYGMSNVKKYIVEKHKGDIYLESEVGKGAKFTIALRIIKDHLSSDERKEVVKSQIYDQRRILLVEDEHSIAEVQYQILTKEPFRHIVSIAINGQTAIDVFDRNKFDVVSLDYMLPGTINGLDVYNHIRKNDKDIPVIFISGNIEFLESMKKLKEIDPNLEHLTKPISNLDYVNNINKLIGRIAK